MNITNSILISAFLISISLLISSLFSNNRYSVTAVPGGIIFNDAQKGKVYLSNGLLVDYKDINNIKVAKVSPLSDMLGER